MRVLFVLLGLLAALPAWSEEVWILQSGPDTVENVPLDPLQPVSAWRGLYSDGQEQIWVYVSRSPHFYPPVSPDVRRVAGTPWTATVFPPAGWTSARKTAWFERWISDFQVLSSLPAPGWPVLFPSVLRKG